MYADGIARAEGTILAAEQMRGDKSWRTKGGGRVGAGRRKGSVFFVKREGQSVGQIEGVWQVSWRVQTTY